MCRIFRDDGRAVVIALDHAAGTDVYPALSDPSRVIDAIVSGGADALLTTIGTIKQFPRNLKSIGVILRADGGNSELEGGVTEHRLMHSAEDALRVGADAVCCMGFPGAPLEAQTLGNLAALASQCQVWGLPLMAEMLPGGFTKPGLRTPEHIRLAARIGVELGADFTKTAFTGSADSFQQVTENCYRPVLVLGGARMGELELLKMVKASLDAGAKGVVIGRNVWGHPQPQAMVMALTRLVHDNVSAEEAMRCLASEKK